MNTSKRRMAMAFRIYAALVWKEWRRRRGVFLLILVAAGGMCILPLCLPQRRPYEQVYANLSFIFFLAAGLLLGADTFSPEGESSEPEFLNTQPVSKGQVWTAKVLLSLGMFSLIYILPAFAWMQLHSRFQGWTWMALAFDVVTDSEWFLSQPLLMFSAGCLCSAILASPLASFLAGMISAPVLVFGGWWLFCAPVFLPVSKMIIPSVEDGVPAVTMLVSSFLVFRRSEWSIPRKAVFGFGSYFLICGPAIALLEFFALRLYFCFNSLHGFLSGLH